MNFDQLLNKNCIMVLDTETTGLGPQDGREDTIISIGAAILKKSPKGYVVVDRYHSFIKPEERFIENGRADTAMNINKITIQDLNKAKPIEWVAEDFYQWTEGHPIDSITAYNIAFDRPFLDPQFVCFDDERWGPCIMLEFAEIYGDFNSFHGNYRWKKLSVAQKYYDVKLPAGEQLHNAGADAYLAAIVLSEMLRKQESIYKNQKSEGGA